MFWKFLLAAAVLSLIALADPIRADAASPLDPEKISVALETGNPDDVAYITYTVALVDLAVLTGDLVGSAFQWARGKPVGRKKFQYYKHAVIELATRVGVTMPRGTPDLTPTIQGRVVMRVVLVDVPVPGTVVRIRDTTRETFTDTKGNFTFENVPYGLYTIDAFAAVILEGSTDVALPNPVPPAIDPDFVTVRVK